LKNSAPPKNKTLTANKSRQSGVVENILPISRLAVAGSGELGYE
jgi:hypothetical protein